MSTTSAILAAAAPVTALGNTGTVARPITKRPLPPNFFYPDQAQNGTVLINISDGTIEGETPGHVAVTINNTRYETKKSADEILEVLRARSQPGSWDPQGDIVKTRRMLTRFFLDTGISMTWLRPVISMTPEARSAIVADLEALAAL